METHEYAKRWSELPELPDGLTAGGEVPADIIAKNLPPKHTKASRTFVKLIIGYPGNLPSTCVSVESGLKERTDYASSKVTDPYFKALNTT